MREYYVSHNNEQMGPFNLATIEEKVGIGQLTVTDYIYDPDKNDWVLLMDFDPLKDRLRNAKPKGPPSGNTDNETNEMDAALETGEDEWFILKWDNRYGPFSYREVIKMLQEKTVFEFDYIWKKKMETWQRIAELSDFGPDKIKGLKTAGDPEVSEVFFRRRHMRTEFNGSIIIHDNKKVWKGQSLEISEGGAGVIMNNATVLPGQKLYLHFKPGDSVPPFNAICEVVSKRFVKGVKDRNAPISYGVKFLDINNDIVKNIRKHVATSEKPAA